MSMFNDNILLCTEWNRGLSAETTGILILSRQHLANVSPTYGLFTLDILTLISFWLIYFLEPALSKFR